MLCNKPCCNFSSRQGILLLEEKVELRIGLRYVIGVVNGPMKNEKSRQILSKSRNLAQPSNGSRSLRFCICQSYICFSIKSLNFSVSVLDFKMSVSASRRVSNFSLPFATPIVTATFSKYMANKCSKLAKFSGAKVNTYGSILHIVLVHYFSNDKLGQLK